MKKMLVMATLVAFAAPVFAGDKQVENEGPKHFQGPRHEMAQNPQMQAQMKAKQAEMKAQQEKMKATEEKLEKLVKEYKKAKEGSKKQTAAKEEIGQVLGEMREEQIAFRAQKIADFEARLADMKARLAAEQSAEKKTEWVNQMTQRVIENDGKVNVFFGPKGPKGKGFGKGPHKDFFKKGFKHDPMGGPEGMEGGPEFGPHGPQDGPQGPAPMED